LVSRGKKSVVERANPFALLVGNVEDLDFGVEHLRVVVLGEVQSVHACGKAENAVDDAAELEVGAQRSRR